MTRAPIGELFKPKAERPETTLTLLDAIRKPAATIANYCFTDSIRVHFETILESVATGRGQGFWIQAEYGAGKTHFLATLTSLLSATEPNLWGKVQNPEIRNYGKRLDKTRLFPVVINLRGRTPVPGMDRGNELLLILEEEIQNTLDARNLRGKVAVTSDDELLAWFDSRPPNLKGAIDTFIREKTRLTPNEYRVKAGASQLANLVRKYCREQGANPQITANARDRFKHIYEQLQAAGYQGLLIVIDEFAFWQDQRPVGSPEHAQDEEILETLAFLLPKEYGLGIFTIVASQKPAPTKLQGSQLGDRFFEMRLLEKPGEYEQVVSWRVRELVPERLPEVNQYYDFYFQNFEFMKGTTRETFQAIFPFQPRCFEALRRITATGLPTARAGINALYDIVSDKSLALRDGLLTVSDLLTSPNLCEDLNDQYKTAYQAYQTAIDGMVNLDLSGDDRVVAERVVKTLFLWHLAYADAPRPLSDQELSEATLTSPAGSLRSRDIVLLALKRLELPQISYSKEKGALFVVTGVVEGPAQIFGGFKARITDIYRIEREWERALAMGVQESGGESSLFGDLTLGESKTIKTQHNKIEYTGEMMLVSGWRSDHGEALKEDAHFRVVFLTKSIKVATDEIMDPRVAVCVPEELSDAAKEATRDYLALQDLNEAYRTKVGKEAEAVREWIRSKRSEVIRELLSKQQSAYRAGQIYTKQNLSLDAKTIFVAATSDARLGQIATALLANAYKLPLNSNAFKTTLKANDAGKCYAGLLQGDTAPASRSAVENFAVGLELAKQDNPRKFDPEDCRVFELVRAQLDKAQGDLSTWKIYSELGKDPHGLPTHLITLYILAFVRYGHAGPANNRSVELQLKPEHGIILKNGSKPTQSKLTAATVTEIEWKAGLDRYFETLTYSTEVSWTEVLPFARKLDSDLKATADPVQAREQNQRLVKRLGELSEGVTHAQKNLELLAARLGDKVESEQGTLLTRLNKIAADTPSYVTFDERLRDAGYTDPKTLENDLQTFQRVAALSNAAAEVLDAKSYLENVELPVDADKELVADRLSILSQLQFKSLSANPSLWASIKEQYEQFKARYRSAYQIHHRKYYANVAELREQLEKAARELDALRRLNSIAELGEPVGAGLSAQHKDLIGRLRTCSVTDVNAINVSVTPMCEVCHLKLADRAPVAEVENFLKTARKALEEQLRRLSAAAIRRILTESGGNRIEKFIRVLEASDLSALANVLDDDLTKFIRTLIRDANIQTEASNVLETLADKYPAVEEEKLGDVVEEFQQLLLKAFAEAKKKNRDKKIRISLK